MRTEKQRDARASVPELVRRARERGTFPVDARIDRTTVWRACRRMSLPSRQRPHKRETDTRRWRYAERMQCVLADGKHFRAGAARLRRMALFFLDDATCACPLRRTTAALCRVRNATLTDGSPPCCHGTLVKSTAGYCSFGDLYRFPSL